MNGVEMIRRLRLHLQDREEPYRTSTDQIWQWIQSTYMRIQLESDQWDFMNKRGLFITTDPNVPDYTVKIQAVRSISPYYQTPGTTAHLPMYLRKYQEWALEQQSGVRRDGPPLYLIEMPSHQWKVDPTPDRVYNIYADYWLRAQEFESMEDEPIWDEQYHEVLLLEAMKIAAALRPESQESVLMQTHIATQLPTFRLAFNHRYLPAIGRPAPLL